MFKKGHSKIPFEGLLIRKNSIENFPGIATKLIHFFDREIYINLN